MASITWCTVETSGLFSEREIREMNRRAEEFRMVREAMMLPRECDQLRLPEARYGLRRAAAVYALKEDRRKDGGH